MISWDFPNKDGSGEFRCKVVPHPPPEDYAYETCTYTTGWCRSGWDTAISGKTKASPEIGGHHGMLIAAIACDLIIQGMPPEEVKREFGKIPAFRKRMESLERDFSLEGYFL